jgi:hypothetical protein
VLPVFSHGITIPCRFSETPLYLAAIIDYTYLYDSPVMHRTIQRKQISGLLQQRALPVGRKPQRRALPQIP